MMTITVMQHTEQEGPGTIADWAAAQDLDLAIRRPAQGDLIQQLNPAALDGLLVLGGPQSVNAEEPWLAAERILIRSLIKLGRPVVGIGLGAQQIVRALGAPVWPLDAGETGRTTVELDHGQALPVFTWHHEQMGALPGARVLASNDSGMQAFTYHRRTLGIQFHPEWSQAQQAARGATPMTGAQQVAVTTQLNQWLADAIL